MRTPFCDLHTSTREDDGTGSDTTCTAYLADGLAMECPYDSIADAKNQEFPCVNGRPMGEEMPWTEQRSKPTELQW